MPLPALVVEIKKGMGIALDTPRPKAIQEAVEGLGIEEECAGLKAKEKANLVAVVIAL